MPAADLFQGHLSAVLKQIFPKDQITVNTRKEATLINPATGRFIELDIILPEHNLCFEFQDNYHYTSTWYSHVPVHEVQQSDTIKLNMVNQQALTMVVVPYWWDGSKESLVATISFHRPDLSFEFEVLPIPLNNTPIFADYTVDGVGEVMLASFASSAVTLRESISSKNVWWMGEKYDGVRGIWNSKEKSLYSRMGNSIDIQSHGTYLGNNVTSFLDGEIWFGRGEYLNAFRLLKTIDTDASYMRLAVFDNPVHYMQSLPFEQRYEHLLGTLSNDDPFSIVVARALCSGSEYQLWLQHVISDGGEGLMMRKHNSLYENGRASSLMKLKAFRGDTEALVVDMASTHCTLKMPSGVTFSSPLPATLFSLRIGDVVTLEYDRYSSKDLIPISPTINRVRMDLNWEDVVHDYSGDVPSEQLEKSVIFEPKREEVQEEAQNDYGFELFANRRNFFEEFASQQKFDPLIAKNWYSVKRELLVSKKGFISLLKKWYEGKLGHALEHIFPEIGFSKEKYYRFHWTPARFFADVSNRRAFFDKIAKRFGFDPLVASNWYSTSRYTITSNKDALNVLAHHKGKYRQALVDLYPDIGLSLKQFTKQERTNTGDKREIKKAMRKQLVEFARSRHLNPSLDSSWYSIPLEQLRKDPKIAAILKYFKDDPIKMLTRLFPKLRPDPSQFSTTSKQYSARETLLNFAKSSGFDPLTAENWYPIKREQVLNFAGAITMLKGYGGRVGHAIYDVFPDIGFRIKSYYRLRS